MVITFIWDGDYPWDIRVEKVCETLIEQGHEIHLVCRNTSRKPLEDKYKGLFLHRLPYLPKFLGKFNDAFTFPAFFSPLWLFRILTVTLKNRGDLIIVRDLPMALAGIFISKLTGRLCVLDMAECYPEMLRCTWKFEGRSFRNYFLRNPSMADAVERLVMKHIDQVWVMIEESEDRLLSMGVAQEKIKVVSNTPIVSRFENHSKILEKKDKLKLIYVGLLNPSRGLDTTIKAVSKYVKKNPNFEFTIVGRGKAERELKELVETLNLTDYVSFLGWVDNTEVPRLISEADIGIVPHHKCSHWDNTIPNKLFDYMASEKAVIVSNVDPMARIVEEVNCGLVYRDYDEEGLSKVIDALSEVEVRQSKADAGRKAIINKYNWSKEEVVIQDAISNIELRAEGKSGR